MVCGPVRFQIIDSVREGRVDIADKQSRLLLGAVSVDDVPMTKAMSIIVANNRPPSVSG
jgi:hypothetical protein